MAGDQGPEEGAGVKFMRLHPSPPPHRMAGPKVGRPWASTTAWICAAVLLVGAPAPLAQAQLREDPEKVLGFAHELLAEGDVYRAISEYKAFLILFPRHPRSAEAWFGLGKGLRQGGDADGALRAFEQAEREESEAGRPWAREAALEIGETLRMAGHPGPAARAFEELARTPRWGEIRGRALQRAAWAWMEARQWGEALRVLGEIEHTDPLREASERLGDEIRSGLQTLPWRDPWVAGGLAALLPGTGHLYAGRHKEAVTSFLLNATFIAGAFWAIREGYLVTGGILSFFELSWYLGGISTAVREARQFNRDREGEWLEGLARRWGQPPLEPGAKAGEPVLRWEFRF